MSGVPLCCAELIIYGGYTVFWRFPCFDIRPLFGTLDYTYMDKAGAPFGKGYVDKSGIPFGKG